VGSRELVALALQRATPLRPDERLLVWDLVTDEASFAALSLRDLEAMICRRIEGSRFSAPALLAEAERDAELLDRLGSWLLVIDDPRYPPLLREAYRPPFALYCRGRPLPPFPASVAVVGTRMPTGRGLEAAHELGAGLAQAGIPVISGLARGIDSAAHRGALAAGGFTCAILACGADAVYPPSNKGLAAELLEAGGLLATEYPPGSEMHKYRFPDRNRVIAGIARSCVVVEAPAGSGALITSDHALQEGRDVWVSAACLGGSRSAGSDALAADGARALRDAAELLEDWGAVADAAISMSRNAPIGMAAGRDLGNASRLSPRTAGEAAGGLAASLRAELKLDAEQNLNAERAWHG